MRGDSCTARYRPFCIALAAGGARILEGTPSPEDRAAYRAPEQVRGEEPDVRSDVFAYGALVYEIASGKRAFPGVGAELSQRILTAAACAATVRLSHFGRS